MLKTSRGLHTFILHVRRTEGALFVLTGLLLSALLTSSVRADTPTLSVWTADKQTVNAGSGDLQTNQWYAAHREIGVQTGIRSTGSEESLAITGLTATCTVPTSLSPFSLDYDASILYCAQWNATYSSLVQQIAAPLTQGTQWSTYMKLGTTNIWVRPPFYAKRSMSKIRLPANQTVTRTLVCEVFIPEGALSGQAVFSVQPISWDIDAEGLDISYVANGCSSSAFTFDSSYCTFVCTSPSGLAGLYTFTNSLEITSHLAKDMNYAPGIQLMYSRIQTDWSIYSSTPSRRLTHAYDNGIRVVVSSPSPILWYNQQMQDQVSWTISSKFAPADANLPGLTQCVLIRARNTGYDGVALPNFFVSAEGTNLVGATLTIPDGTTFPMDVEPEEASFDAISRTDDELAPFTNGTYTVQLYDFTNVLRQTYTVHLSGTAVTETPQLTAPATTSMSTSRPTLSWNAPVDPNVNATVLSIDSPSLSDNLFELWTQSENTPLPTEYAVGTDLFGHWTYELMFAHASITTDNGAQILSGYLAEQNGIFNVQTQNLSFVQLDTDAPRVFTGGALQVDLTTFGFLLGTNYTFTVDFGDGYTTNAMGGSHTYTQPGIYTVSIIVSDGTGAAATGTVSATVCDLPTLSQITHTSETAVQIKFSTIDGAFYRLLYTDDLSNPDWSQAVSTVQGDGEACTLEDSIDSSVPQRFYRLECTLNPSSGGVL